jgi:hypothetical protein
MNFFPLDFDLSMYFKFIFVVIQPDNFFDILYLKGDNYKVWKERILLHLGWMDIDYSIRKDKPHIVTNMMLIKTRIFIGIHDSVDQHEKIHDLLKAIDN